MGYESRDYHRPTGFGGFSFFPPVIKKLLIINIAVYLVQILLSNITFDGVRGSSWFSYWFALNPVGGNFQIWQLFSYQFMHSTVNFMHIFMNMFILWMFGMEIENIWGSRKFLLYYLLCGVGAGILQLLFADAPTIGASGAVYGIMVAFAMFFPNRLIYIYFLLPVKAKYLIVFWIVIEFMSVGDMSLVAHLAHLGGALTGFIFVMFDRRNSINVDKIFDAFKNAGKNAKSKTEHTFRKPFHSTDRSAGVRDAEFYEINKNDNVSQDDIDRILDKISESGYQNLTEKEKKILFEASKKK
ncbi:MAG: rhomboid family intramembrane serine protease [Melioribacteraceae bacterium]|nr:rhomboid family intramembrane serine protease [Melioribacteraceae bacterium]